MLDAAHKLTESFSTGAQAPSLSLRTQTSQDCGTGNILRRYKRTKLQAVPDSSVWTLYVCSVLPAMISTLNLSYFPSPFPDIEHLGLLTK